MTTRNKKWGYDIGVNALFPGDRSVRVDTVTAHFGDVMARAEEFIMDSEQVVGAVAWVRAPRLLRALERRPVSLIVNKEFVLRNGSKERRALDALARPADGFGSCARVLGDCSPGSFTGLMHHKFMVRLTRGVPAAVWTGSFNFTTGAAGNFENAVEIDDPGAATMFYDEFRRLWGASEPLDFRQGRPAAVAAGKPARKRASGKAVAPAKRKAAARPAKRAA